MKAIGAKITVITPATFDEGLLGLKKKKKKKKKKKDEQMDGLIVFCQ